MTKSADEFLELFRHTVGTLASTDQKIDLDTHVVDDLKFDSFQMYLLVEFIEGLLGREIEPGDDEVLRLSDTIRSAYQFYLEKDSEPRVDNDVPVPGNPVTPPSLGGRFVSLRPLEPADYRKLFSLASSPASAWRWRYAGALPSYEEWLQSLSSGVLTQLVVTNHRSDVSGLVVAYNANLNNGTFYMAAMVARDLVGSGGGVEAVILFLRYVFMTWSVVKAYMEVPEFNVDQFGSAIEIIGTIEGRLRGHLVYGSKRWDQLIIAVWREKFAARWMTQG